MHAFFKAWQVFALCPPPSWGMEPSPVPCWTEGIEDKKEKRRVCRSRQRRAYSETFSGLLSFLTTTPGQRHHGPHRSPSLAAHLGSRPHSWDFPGCPVVRTLPSISGGVGSSPGRGAKDSCGCLRLIWINAGCVIIHGIKACHSVKLIMDHYKHLPRHRLAVHLILSM